MGDITNYGAWNTSAVYITTINSNNNSVSIGSNVRSSNGTAINVGGKVIANNGSALNIVNDITCGTETNSIKTDCIKFDDITSYTVFTPGESDSAKIHNLMSINNIVANNGVGIFANDI